MTQSIFIDRRLNPGDKNLPKKQKFFKKINKSINSSIKKAIKEKNIKDFGSVDGEEITINVDDIREYHFSNDPKSGRKYYVFPGNKNYVEGDRIDKKKFMQGQGRGSKASDSGEGQDEFVFRLSREEFLDMFFDDLELPNMVKNSLKIIEYTKLQRDGYTKSGSISNLDIKKTYKSSLGRRIALHKPNKEEIEELEKLISEIKNKIETEEDDEKKKKLLDELREKENTLNELINKFKKIPFFDDIDLIYRNFNHKPIPIHAAVLFCVMDVSGSMTELKKEYSKIFFILLYLFLQKNYKKIDIIFIRHTSEAKEVDEKTFFNSTETGGTVVSSALELVFDIINNRYPINIWNIYVAQASDGENLDTDNEKTLKLLRELLNIVQYYAYIQVNPVDDAFKYMASMASSKNNLYNLYSNLTNEYKNKLQCKIINKKNEIWTVFRELFERNTK